MVQFREISKVRASNIPTRLTDTIANYAVLREHPELLPKQYFVADKARYLSAVAEQLGCPDVRLTFLEFGVYKGKSISYWATLNSNPRSRFVGFDSFEGIPSRWRGRPAGHLSASGQIPSVGDQRISFVKGWFNRTVEGALDVLSPGSEEDAVLVHIDSDLYSSALYCLSILGSRIGRYHVMFDEIGAGEGRALRDYLQAYGGAFNPYLGLKRTSYSILPIAVFGLLDARPTR